MKVRRIDFSPDEWLAGTQELGPYDRGVYITVCALIYSRGERINVDLLIRHLGAHGNAVNASLARLENARKIVRNGLEIGQKRSENELEKAQKRSEKWLENLPDPKKINDKPPPNARARSARGRRNHQPSTDSGVSPLRGKHPESVREAPSPPLPSRGDGDADARAEPAGPTVFNDPQLKADTVAALDRCLDAIHGKLAVLDADATEPPPPDPRLVEFRRRLHRLNAIAGEHLDGALRDQAWTVLAEADALGDPLALPDQMAADLDAIERLDQSHLAEAAE